MNFKEWLYILLNEDGWLPDEIERFYNTHKPLLDYYLEFIMQRNQNEANN